MISEPIEVPRVAGPVTVERTLRRLRVRVGDAEAPRKGRAFLLPATSGAPVRAEMKHGLDPLPSLVIFGLVHRMGPHVPWPLWVVAYAPLIAWGGVGWAGAVAGAAASAVGAVILTCTTWPTWAKTLNVVAICIASIPLADLLGPDLNDWYRDVALGE